MSSDAELASTVLTTIDSTQESLTVSDDEPASQEEKIELNGPAIDSDYGSLNFQHAASSASSFGLNLVTAFETGLRLAGVISTSSYHIAANINQATADFADRSITATTSALSVHVESLVGGLQLNDEWQAKIHNRIQSGSSKLKDAVTSLSTGVDKALSVAHGIASSGINFSLEAVKRLDMGLDSALTSAGIPPSASGNRQRHGLLQAAHAMLEVLAPLSNASPLDVGRALGAVSMIQEMSRMPYPPSRCTLINLNERENRNLLNDLVYRYRQTLAVYTPGLLRLCELSVRAQTSSSNELIKELLGVESEAILVKRDFSEVHNPAHFVILDHSSRSICLIIRGSTEAADILTDFCCQPDATFGSHSGMQSSAASIDNHTRPTVHELCERYPAYRVIVEGHSLGGGTASLLCILWMRDPVISGPDGQRLHAYSFGSPAVLPIGAASQYYNNITSVIYGRDIVARASWGSMKNLNSVLLYLCSKQQRSSVTVPGMSPETSPNLSLGLSRFVKSTATLQNPQYNKDNDEYMTRSYSFDVSPSNFTSSIEDFSALLEENCCDTQISPPIERFVSTNSEEDSDSLSCSPVVKSINNVSEHEVNSTAGALVHNGTTTMAIDDITTFSPSPLLKKSMSPIRKPSFLLTRPSSIVMSSSTEHVFPSNSQTLRRSSAPNPLPLHPSSCTRRTGSRNAYLLEHLKTITTSQLLHLLEARNCLSPTTSQATVDFWDFQIRLAASALQSLHSNENVLSPVGRCILVLPVEHYVLTGRPRPEFLTQGDCVLVELDDEGIAELARDIILTRDAFSDHLPQNLAKALGLRSDGDCPSVEEESELSYFNNKIWDEVESPRWDLMEHIDEQW